MSKIRVAIIGAGNIANIHLESYRNIDTVEIYAICDIDEEQLNKTADRFGITRRFVDVDTMLAELPELDAADVCVWNCNHSVCAIKALNAGLNVLCEKPMAYSADEAKKMLEAAERNKKLLMVGFVCRFEKEPQIVLDFIKNGYLGNIYYTKALFTRRHGNPGGWFADKSKSGGGPVMDLGVHSIDLLRYLMGNPKPVSVYAFSDSQLGKRDHLKNGVGYSPKGASAEDASTVEDFASVMIKYDNGAVTFLETSYSLNAPDNYCQEIYGTGGGIKIDDKVTLYTECNGYLTDSVISTENYKGITKIDFEEELSHFADCIINGTECISPAEDGYEIMRILDAIYESARTGHEVIL